MTVLVVDIGSSSIRALLFDTNLNPIAKSITRRQHQFTTSAEGAATANPKHLQSLTEDCITEVLAHTAAANIQQVGMCTFAGNLLGVGPDGEAITPLFTYADSRSHAYLPDLPDPLQRTGTPLHSAYYPAQWRWLRSTQPRLFEQVHTWLDFATYLYRQWFGVGAPCSYSMASWGGILNRHTLQWDAPLLEASGVTSQQLPPLADYDATQQGLQAHYRRLWPDLANKPFYLAIGDGAAANIGAGATTTGTAALSLGTTAAIRIIERASTPVPPGLWSYRATADHHLTGGATTEGGGIYQWAQKTLELNGVDIESTLTSRQPGEHGLVALPLLGGERSPGWQADATGTLHGIRYHTTPTDILHALLEGVALRLAHLAQDILTEETIIYGVGGALRASPSWAQMICNAINHPLALLSTEEITSRGVAALILHGLDDAAMPQIDKIYTPSPARSKKMLELQQKQTTIYQKFYGKS